MVPVATSDAFAFTASVGAASSGFALGASLIIAIGAQNAFVLRQGIRREHVLAVVSICAGIDATLITLGVAGVGAVLAGNELALDLAALAGAAYLAVFGAISLRSALKPAVLLADEADDPIGAEGGGVGAPAGSRASGRRLSSVVATTLAVSLLNPHVYLDTVVLLGSISAQYPVEARPAFALGAMTASLVWFFSLGFGARLLAPVFARKVAWRVLDAVIAVVMWSVAARLAIGALG